MQKILDVVERVGNKVPHPVVIFLSLTILVIVLSHVLHLAGVSATAPVIETAGPVAAEKVLDSASLSAGQDEYATDAKVVEKQIKVRSLLTAEGIRFMYTSLVPNFMGFAAIGLIVVAMIGVGVSEESGLIKALIRKLVKVAPRWAIAYIMIAVGILSSIAADAGYLVLIPLAGAAFLSVGRHPVAGIAAGFAAVAGAFTVNMFIKPLDAILVEFTNDAIQIVDPSGSQNIGLASNLWFSIASVILLVFTITFITQRLIEPRLGVYHAGAAAGGEGAPSKKGGSRAGSSAAGTSSADKGEQEPSSELTPAELRGLRWAGVGVIGVLILFGLLAVIPGAPLRDPDSGALIGDTPFMSGLIAVIMILFLVTGTAYGLGAGTLKGLPEVIKAIEKSVSGLGSLIFLLLILAQFIAYFNFSNLGSILALSLSDLLQGANVPPLLLLLGFIVVVALLDFLITGAIAKWALFAPVFVPLLMNLGVDPEAVLAAYRVADSPINVITPLNAYFALVVTFAQKYDSKAGVGTVISLMLPYVAGIFVVWTGLFVLWHLTGLPWGI
jgi:aminobenzoyl-glutamate transport protein